MSGRLTALGGEFGQRAAIARTFQNSLTAAINANGTLQVFGHNTDGANYTALDPATFAGPSA